MIDYNDIEKEFGAASEPMALWGGSWTEQKLDAFAKYVAAYLTIMNNYRDKYNWKLIYFDGFAGSGSRGESEPYDETDKGLFDISEIDIDKSESEVYVGAAERVLQISIRGFDYYYFNERNQESINALKAKLSRYSSVNARLEFRCNDANADVWILVPTGVIINRLLDGKGELLFSNKLQKFFGMSESEIRSFFYEDRTEMTLFGEETYCYKLPNAIRRIADLYITKLSEIFKYVLKEPLILYNRRGIPIFHYRMSTLLC